jgi:predicted nucleotidyltransferase
MTKTSVNSIKTLTKLEKTALGTFLTEVSRQFKDNLEAVILYGSKCRGEKKSDSDIDLLLILRDLTQRLSIKNFLVELESRLNIKSGVLIEGYPVSYDYYQRACLVPFIKNIQREGVVIWSR